MFGGRATTLLRNPISKRTLATKSFLLSGSRSCRGCPPRNAHHNHLTTNTNKTTFRSVSTVSPLSFQLTKQQQQPRTSGTNGRSFSTTTTTTTKDLPVKILYASQGGTAQIFAMQLTEALLEVQPDLEVTTQGLDEGEPLGDLLQPGQALHVFLASTTGVGEPPDNARAFYNDWLTPNADAAAEELVLEGMEYCVFGLGNQKAHPNHYNVIGKGLYEKLLVLGAKPVYPLGLGDDGECIEDDYDEWMEGLIDTIYKNNTTTTTTATTTTTTTTIEGEDEAATTTTTTEEDDDVASDAAAKPSSPAPASAVVVEDPDIILEPCLGAKDESGTRRVSTKYPRLILTPSGKDLSRDDLLELDVPFYMENTKPLPVITNRPLNAHAGENGLFEMRVSLEGTGLQYETGDHVMVYPQNSEALAEGYLQHFDVDPHVTIETPPPTTASDSTTTITRKYPHPTGITLMETLKHCVDLSAVPSPAVARMLLGRKQIDYKNEIATPRRTVLDLLSSATRKFSVEEILYNLPPMKARYYSIASSSVVHPNEVYLVYRPVQYTTTQGHLRLGTSTSYLKNMMGIEDAEMDDYHIHHQNGPYNKSNCSYLIAAVNSNPTFRLPSDRQTPVLFVAGGCGVAPIRAFLEERIWQASQKSGPFGEGYLFLGFRSPADAPYKSLIQRAFQCGAISNLHLTYNAGCNEVGIMSSTTLGAAAAADRHDDLRAHSSCGLVSDAVGEHGEQLYSFFERQGHTFICGGARLFGVAIENQVHSILQKQGHLSEEEATEYLRQLLAEGRFNEDLSD